MIVNRRAFIRTSIAAALGGAGLFSASGSLKLIAAAAAAGRRARPLTDYKALLCVFLAGGNDAFNTVVPVSGSERADYVASRGALALDGLHALTPQPGGGPSNYGMHPAMPELAGLFNSGKLAVVANVGTLLYPTTQADYQNGTVVLPPQLYSHDDQTTQWQTSRPDDSNADGWGGRIADLLYATNSGQLPMSISLDGANRFQRGTIVSPYALDSGGVNRLSYADDGPESWVIGDNPDGAAAYAALIEPGTQANALERQFAQSMSRTITNYRLLDTALAGAPVLQTAFPDSDFGNQLAMIAKVISVRDALGMSRQVFFISTGAYDTHSEQLDTQNDDLADLSQGLAAFQAAMAELGTGGNVTTFTASDFGRSLAVNEDGTDHGWGGHHLVLGDAVNGGRFFGTLPSLAPYEDGNPASNPDDTGWGQIIPTTAVDQYAATLAGWFGVDSGGIGDIFPNLGRFASADLGFMG